MSTREASAQLRIGALVLGAFLGQGSMLAAQSFLISRGGSAFVGEFGYGLAILSFGWLVADWSAGLLLTRAGASREIALAPAAAFWARIPIAALATVLVVSWSLTTSSAVVKHVVWFGAWSLLLGPVNYTGLVDGLARSHRTGLFSGMAWTFASVAALREYLVNAAQSQASGITIGIAYSLGILLSSALNAYVARDILRSTDWRFNKNAALAFLKEGAFLNVGSFPSQLFGRAVLGYLGATAGMATTGLYLFARNLAVGVNQVVLIIRRVELRSLVQALDGGERSLRTLMWSQRASAFVSAGYIALAGMCFVLVAALRLGDLEALAGVVFLVATTTLPLALSTAAATVTVALHGGKYVGTITFASVLVGTGVMVTTGPVLGLAAAVLAELVMHAIQLGACLRVAQRLLQMQVQPHVVGLGAGASSRERTLHT